MSEHAGPSSFETSIAMKMTSGGAPHSGAAAVGGEFAIGAGLDQEGIFKGVEMPGLTHEGVLGEFVNKINNSAQMGKSVTESMAGVANQYVTAENPSGTFPNGAFGDNAFKEVGPFQGAAKELNITPPSTPTNKLLDDIQAQRE